MFTESLGLLEIWIRLLAAITCGGVIGWEREAARKSAGFRTHIMVAVGAATFTLVALMLYSENARYTTGSPGDPTRAIQGVVTGIGFLGAGAILRGREHVKGLTTAASIWVVGALGTACGTGMFKLAAIVTVHAIVILALVPDLQHSDKEPANQLKKGGKAGPGEDDEDEDDPIPSLPTG